MAASVMPSTFFSFSVSGFTASLHGRLKFSQWQGVEGCIHEKEKFKHFKGKPFSFMQGTPKPKLEPLASSLVRFVISEDQSTFTTLKLDTAEPDELNIVEELGSDGGSLSLPIERATGKPGYVSFHGLLFEKRREKLEAISGKERSKLFWFIGPTVLVAFLVLPSLYLRHILSTVFEDSLLTDFLILFFTEALFYGGVAIFVLLIDYLWRPLELVDMKNSKWSNIQIGLRVSSVTTLALSLIIPLVTMGMVWPWTGPAASATLAPYLVGLVVQFAFEQYARRQRSPAWPVIPIIFQVYRLHQLNRAAQLVTALSFSVRGSETTPQTLAINSSLGTLLTVLQILGVICIWSFSSFLMSAAIFKSFRKKLAAGSISSTPRSSFKSYVETCASLLRRCSCPSSLLSGLSLHGHVVKCGVSSDRSVFTKLLCMYSEFGQLADRNRIFMEFASSDIFSWNFMITASAREGDIDAASKLFDGMPDRNVVSWTIIIDELMKRGRVHDAMWYFERCPCHTVVSCTAMIHGYVRNGMNLDGLMVLHQMIRYGLMPNEVTFTCVLTACGCSGKFGLGLSVVGMVIKSAFNRNLSVCNSLITLYLRMGDFGMARKVFNGMVERDVVSWTTLLDVCFQMGDLKEARRVFNDMPDKNEVSWSMMITRYSQSGEALEAFRLFNFMFYYGFKPNVSSFASVISALASLENLTNGRCAHSHVIKFGFENDVFVASSLIDMYSKCGKSCDACQVFGFLTMKNIVCWNAMVGGYLYDRKVAEAKCLFMQIPEKNAASWNAMMSGLVQNELYEDVLEVFNEMLASGQVPNRMTFSSVLLACANLPSLDKGKNLHAKTVKLGISSEVFVGTALIDMYAKSGDIKSSKSVFNMMPEKNEVCWTAIIQGLADSGLAEESLALFEDMKRAGIIPCEPIFLSVLSACSHCRLVDKGFHYFESMGKLYNITPKERHYTAMVDLLSRAGLLREAEEFINKMPIEPEANTWAALLSGCATHGNAAIGEKAAKMVIVLEKQRTAGYVLLSNIYASAGRWKNVAKVRTLMRETGLKKGGGCSWIQIRDCFHIFYSWDSNHPNAFEIYEVLKLLIPEMVPCGL